MTLAPGSDPKLAAADDDSLGILQFLRDCERLKTVLRTSWTTAGTQESTASHSWRLCLAAMLFAPRCPGVDLSRLLQMCVIHDLGEAIGGDVPAIHPSANSAKAANERRDLVTLMTPLPQPQCAEILSLWDEYEAAATPTAQLAKALDKLETLLQHNQGANPADFDYAFNIDYGRRFTDQVPMVAALRQLVDAETRANAERRIQQGTARGT